MTFEEWSDHPASVDYRNQFHKMYEELEKQIKGEPVPAPPATTITQKVEGHTEMRRTLLVRFIAMSSIVAAVWAVHSMTPHLHEVGRVRLFIVALRTECAAQNLPNDAPLVFANLSDAFRSRLQRMKGLRQNTYAIESLGECLEDTNPHVQQLAMYSLYEIASPAKESVNQFIECLDHPDTVVRALAQDALVRLRPPVQALLDGFAARSVQTRVAIIETIEELAPRVADGPYILIQAIDDPAPGVRLSVYRAIAAFGKRGCKMVPSLRRKLREEDRLTQFQIGLTLWAITDESEIAMSALTDIVADLNHDEIIVTLDSLASHQKAPEAIPVIMPLATAKEADIRQDLAICLGRIRAQPDIALPVLKMLAADKDEDVSCAASWALREYENVSEVKH